MASIENTKFRFIKNVGEYYLPAVFGENFYTSVKNNSDVYNQAEENTASDLIDEKVKNEDFRDAFSAKIKALKKPFESYREKIITENSEYRDKIKATHDFNTEILKCLDYTNFISKPYDPNDVYHLEGKEDSIVPIRHIIKKNDNSVKILIMEMQNLIKIGDNEPDGLFQQHYDYNDEEKKETKNQRYLASQWQDVFDYSDYTISPSVINKAISSIFLEPDNHRPKYILMLAGNVIFLFDKDSWHRGAYLEISLDELFSQANIN